MDDGVAAAIDRVLPERLKTLQPVGGIPVVFGGDQARRAGPATADQPPRRHAWRIRDWAVCGAWPRPGRDGREHRTPATR
jgi:hypothetical protein